LLYAGRAMGAQEGVIWGFFNKVVEAEFLEEEVEKLATQNVSGPGFGHMITKTLLAQQWLMSVEQAIEAEA